MSTTGPPSDKIIPEIDADGIIKPQQVKIHSSRFLDHLQTNPGADDMEGDLPVASELPQSQELDILRVQNLTATENDDIEEPKLRAEYAVWKKNAPYLYDLMVTTRIGWPSLTVEWLPDIEQVAGGLKRHKLLLGTQTSGTDNEYLRIGSIDIPTNNPLPDLAKYDADKGEIGGYLNSAHTTFSVKQKISHYGEVNKARYMPQNPSMVASMSSFGTAYVFDCTKHSLQSQGNPKPDMRLHHHTEEGFALSWNRFKSGILATGANDSTVALWNLKTFRKGKPLTPTTVIKTHSGPVNEVEWHAFHPSVLGSVSDDKKIHIHDTRLASAANTPALTSQGGHTSGINCLAFNPSNENFLATGSSDKTIVLWDIRQLSVPLHAMANAHSGAIDSITWSPHFETVLASGSTDRRVMIWDTAQVGLEQTPEEAEQGPPELLFIHGGHTEVVSDVAWSPDLPWVLASVSNDNHLHIFRPADTIVGKQ